MPRRSLVRVKKEIRRAQSLERNYLRSSIVGRPIELEPEATLNRFLTKLSDEVTYRRVGQIAVVYLFRREMREQLGQVYYNRSHVAAALTAAPATSQKALRVTRSELRVSESFIQKPQGVTLKQYWLSANGLSAVAAKKPNNPVSMAKEEIAIANHLFCEDNDITGRPVLWLGTLAAPSLEFAEMACEALNDKIAMSLLAQPVSLIPSPDRVVKRTR